MVNIYNLEQRLQSCVDNGQITGLALAIVHGTEITYARGFGLTSVEDGGLPVTPQTLFCIGSISKTLTSALIMHLVEQGKLDLNASVMSYLPGFRFSDPEAGQRITLRHILSHTTGLPPAGKNFGPRDADALKRFVWEEIPRYGFIAPPGKVHLYSSTVFVLAGYLAEVVTGKYFDTLMQEMIFAPLEMTRSTFDRTVAMTYPLALAHDRDASGTLRTKHRFIDNVSGNPSGFGLSSTLDLAHFAIMHLNTGRFQSMQWLSPESIALMQMPHISRYLHEDAGYGLALFTGSYKGVRWVVHWGLQDGYWCVMSLFPDRGVGVIVQSNHGDEPTLVRLVDEIYDDLLNLPAKRPEPVTVAPDRSLWPLHEGTYLSVEYGLLTVTVVKDQLLLDNDGEIRSLVAIEHELYQAGQTQVGFLHEGDGPTEYLIFAGQPYRRFSLDPSFVPDPAAWRAYAVTYQDVRENPYLIRIRVTDTQLLIKWGDADEVVCTALSQTSFVSSGGLIDFEVAEEGGEPVLITHKATHYHRKDDMD